MRQIAVIGLGKFGSTVARHLSRLGVQVLAIDERKELVDEIKDDVSYAATLNATDEEALKAVGIQGVDVAVVCIGEDVEANLLTTILLKRLGTRCIWARAISPLQQEILKALAIDNIISIEEEIGKIVARSLVSRNVTKHIPLSPGHSLAEIRVPGAFVGRTLRKIDARSGYRVNIVAVKRRVPKVTEYGERTFDEETERVPSPDAELNEGDVLVVIGRDEDIERFSQAR